jgi:branched-chain amino acid aminotransferase
MPAVAKKKINLKTNLKTGPKALKKISTKAPARGAKTSPRGAARTSAASPANAKSKPAKRSPKQWEGLSALKPENRKLWSAPIDETPLIWVNGQLVPKSKAMVSVYDHGLLYGDGVFEGIRIYKGKIFKLKQHTDRLYRCAEQIGLKIPITPEEMVNVQRMTIEANGIEDGYIRLVVTRGYGTLGLDPRRCPVPGVICIADQIRLYSEESYNNGMRVIVAKRPKTPTACLDPRIKSLNYLNNILAKVEAIMAGCDEAIMLSTDGWVTECTGDNLFIIKDGAVFTPPNSTGNSGSLEGITQRFVRDELIPMCGFKCHIREMRLDEVVEADEVFLTGTAAEIIAVNQIDDHKIGSKGEGPVTKKLRSKFREVVTSDEIPED